MNEIYIRIPLDALEQPARGVDFDAVPAHVRDFQSFLFRDFANAAREDVQTVGLGTFLACREEKLQSETDAEERLAARDKFLYRLSDAELFHVVDRVAEGAYSRENSAVR